MTATMATSKRAERKVILRPPLFIAGMDAGGNAILFPDGMPTVDVVIKIGVANGSREAP